MIKSFKVKLKLNNKQRNFLKRNSDVSRFVYNWTLEQQITSYKNGGKFVSNYDLRKRLTKLKKSGEFSWIYDYDCDIVKQAVKDGCNAYIKFFKKQNKFPRFKSRKTAKPSFFVDNYKIKIFNDGVKIPKLKSKVRFYEKGYIPFDIKYSNPRISSDGISWFLSVGYDTKIKEQTLGEEVLGIDLGLKNLAICSNGKIYKNNNKSKRIKLLRKKLKRKQRKISKKYILNKVGNKFIKTNNIKKEEKNLKKVYIKISDIQKDYFNKIAIELVRTKPKTIVMEDLNLTGMMKNKHLSKSLQESNLYMFKNILFYKSKEYGINFIEADRFFPSSKLCSRCHTIKKDLKLHDRVYKCDVCGLEIDRDFGASLNLSQYPKFLGNLSLWRTKNTRVA